MCHYIKSAVSIIACAFDAFANFLESPFLARLGDMTFQRIGNILLFGVALYFAYFEFDREIFEEPIFLLLMWVWGIITLCNAIEVVKMARRKTEKEILQDIPNKIDELIKEIRRDRASRGRVVRYVGNKRKV